jgi:hypothetical protein
MSMRSMLPANGWILADLVGMQVMYVCVWFVCVCLCVYGIYVYVM